jgi:molybdopterin synthase sulfur carrier subunit
MEITVKFFTVLREITGKKDEKVKFSNSLTIDGLLNYLSRKHGRQFTDYVYNASGKPRGYLQFLINGKGIATLEGFRTRLKEGDKVAIIPPVGGG